MQGAVREMERKRDSLPFIQDASKIFWGLCISFAKKSYPFLEVWWAILAIASARGPSLLAV
jgi:hypothetical protein